MKTPSSIAKERSPVGDLSCMCRAVEARGVADYCWVARSPNSLAVTFSTSGLSFSLKRAKVLSMVSLSTI